VRDCGMRNVDCGLMNGLDKNDILSFNPQS
jgi:hypothetical protein